jgi:hypothetical protein
MSGSHRTCPAGPGTTNARRPPDRDRTDPGDIKWLTPVGWILVGFGVLLDPNRSGAPALVVLILGVITLGVGAVWDRFWRINNDAGTFFY